MSVCDEKISKLKERIDSELPNYSKEQIKRSRELSFDSSLNKKLFIHNIKDFQGKNLFPVQKDLDSLKKAFQDQTEIALKRSRDVANSKHKYASFNNSSKKSSINLSEENVHLEQLRNKVEEDNFEIINKNAQNCKIKNSFNLKMENVVNSETTFDNKTNNHKMY